MPTEARVAVPTGIAAKTRFGGDARQGAASEEYVLALTELARPIACMVAVDTAFPRGDFAPLSIEEAKDCLSFRYENGSYGYRNLTHTLGSDFASFGLVCSYSGEVELYRLDVDDEGNGALVAKYQAGRRILDPMFAFISMNRVYVVLNEPTQSIFAAGSKARKPAPSADGSLIVAAGCPKVICFDLGASEADDAVPDMEPLSRYVVGLLDDPDGPLPLLMVANILAIDNQDDEIRPSFRKLIGKYIFDDDEYDLAEDRFPIGISVSRLGEEAAFIQVPMSGSPEYGIRSVGFAESDSDENTINIVALDEPPLAPQTDRIA